MLELTIVKCIESTVDTSRDIGLEALDIILKAGLFLKELAMESYTLIVSSLVQLRTFLVYLLVLLLVGTVALWTQGLYPLWDYMECWVFQVDALNKNNFSPREKHTTVDATRMECLECNNQCMGYMSTFHECLYCVDARHYICNHCYQLAPSL